MTYLLDKMRQIKRLEQEQFQKNTAPQMPLWNTIKAHDIKPFDALQDSLNEGLHTLQSFTTEPALSALKKAITKKKAQLKNLENNLQAVQKAFEDKGYRIRSLSNKNLWKWHNWDCQCSEKCWRIARA